MTQYFRVSFPGVINHPNGTTLTSFENLSPTAMLSFERAMQSIEDTIDVEFITVPATSEDFAYGTEAEFRISAGPIDGPSNVLAYAVSFGFGPTGPGDQVYDISEAGSIYTSLDGLYTVAAHELMHSLGGPHSGNPNHLMWPQIDNDTLGRFLATDEAVRWQETLGWGTPVSNSEKMDGFEGQTYGLYQTVFDRDPDNVGFAHHQINLTNNAYTIEVMADAFINSTEAIQAYGTMTDAEFVTEMYSNAFDRAPDAAGLNGWLQFLASGGSRADLVLGFALSQEMNNFVQQEFSERTWYDPDLGDFETELFVPTLDAEVLASHEEHDDHDHDHDHDVPQSIVGVYNGEVDVHILTT